MGPPRGNWVGTEAVDSVQFSQRDSRLCGRRTDPASIGLENASGRWEVREAPSFLLKAMVFGLFWLGSGGAAVLFLYRGRIVSALMRPSGQEKAGPGLVCASGDAVV